MKFFADAVTRPYIQAAGYRSVCEIGASFGEHTDRLLEAPEVRMTLVDPCLDVDLAGKYAGEPRVAVERGLSLEVLPRLSAPFDCVLIDGDHNWYTVYNELRTLHERGLLRPGGTVFLHDVGFPYGRRDQYYQPDTIPAERRQPFAQKGIVEGRSELVDEGGVNGWMYNADHEGGPRNGVLTAVEDFVREHAGEYLFYRVRTEQGLGMLYRRGDNPGPAFFRVWRLRARFGRYLAPAALYYALRHKIRPATP